MISRYKTYAYQEYFYSYYGYHFRKGFICTHTSPPSTTVIAVIKTADKTMKITYTLTETEEA